MKESLPVLCVNFEAEKEVFVRSEGDASPTSLDEHREERGDEPREYKQTDEGGPGEVLLEDEVDTHKEVGGQVQAAQEDPGAEVGGARRLHPDTFNLIYIICL